MQLKIYSKTLIYHLIFWVIYSILNAYAWYTFDNLYNIDTYFGLTRLPIKLVAVYINYSIILRFCFKKRYPAFFLLALLNLVLMGALQCLISENTIPNFGTLMQYSLPIYSVVAISSVFIIARQYFVQMKLTNRYEVEKIKDQLDFLKAQMQPHFLFNTLNNIYSQTFSNPEHAGKSVLKLSDILRYVLYDSAFDRVSLQKEVSHIQDFIDLEKIRFADRLEISFSTSGNFTGKEIAPLLLVPFIENSFKHASAPANEKIWITIDLIVKNEELFFTVENSICQSSQNSASFPYSGIGLLNSRKRLSMIYSDYIFDIEETQSYFHIYLHLSLNQTKNYG